ncbi:MAG: NAD(P)H-dependent oxidoreductase [Candidatus Dojkabacteria bacterium]|nr:NAD(P)H-dependent oxidoreductase [Candidatus Dojkabacteria bacterium]MDQ7020753.1 NAD(P)H-dependent oxidoreductase [Candidatus Dojkabacteria bacterium]
MDKLNITIIVGTTRKNRMSIYPAMLVKKIGEEIDEILITFVDVIDFFPLPGEGNDEESKDSRWVDINKKSDAYIIVAPEYNHGYPGSLKMLLDNDLGNYTHKPVCIAGVSSGMFGGARMIENLINPLREMGFVTTHSDLFFPKVQDMFDENGELKAEFNSQIDYIKKSFNELIWMAKCLKWRRDNLDSK